MSPTRTASATYAPGLLGSLALLGIIIALALAQLAWAGNWPKVLRVAAAAATYAAVLLPLCRTHVTLRPSAFIAAGAAAGAVSGLVRPTTSAALVGASVLGAALLLGPLHWWALRTWQRQAGVAA
ncbi:MAG TPA: hypothetical protein VFS33_06640 [Gemmatimonadales bacterium]|jgi:hypothetical protein|nr:hypothetical protein [Gemmatimonadales bacterium]